eukprot:3591920-Amphidinium_carterae.2
MELDQTEYIALMTHLTRGYEPNAQTSIQSLPHVQQVNGVMMVDIFCSRTPRRGQEIVAPVGAMPMVSPLGTQKIEAAGQM